MKKYISYFVNILLVVFIIVIVFSVSYNMGYNKKTFATLLETNYIYNVDVVMSKNVSLIEVKSFIEKHDNENGFRYTCFDFAYDLYRDAMLYGIKSDIISIGMYDNNGEFKAHAVVRFKTTDGQVIYYDPTISQYINIEINGIYNNIYKIVDLKTMSIDWR